MARWQYQIKAEIPYFFTEAYNLVASLGCWPDIIPQKSGLLAAIQAGSEFSPLPFPTPVDVLVDRYIGSWPDILFRKPELLGAIQSGSIFWPTYFIPGVIPPPLPTNYLQMGFELISSYGKKIITGGIDRGYEEKLEDGVTFDGTTMTSTFRTGRISFGDWDFLTKVKSVKHMAVAKSHEISATLKHYGDGNSSPSTETISCDLYSTTNRVVLNMESKGWPYHTFHAIQGELTQSDEEVGYEPIGLCLRIQPLHEDIV